MIRSAIQSWLVQEFQPLSLATASATITQHIETAIRYWNTHSAYGIFKTNTVDHAVLFVEVDQEVKTVIDVYPNDFTDDYFANHPMYVLLGYVTLDRFTQDFMIVSHVYEAYRRFLNANFSWNWIKSGDPTKKGKIYFQNIPDGVTNVSVLGLKRIRPDEDITDEHILEWILEYSKSLVKVTEGNILRKSSMIGITNDGTSLLNEGKEEQTALQERLRKESRWAVLAVRL